MAVGNRVWRTKNNQQVSLWNAVKIFSIYTSWGKPSGFQPQAHIAQLLGHVLM